MTDFMFLLSSDTCRLLDLLFRFIINTTFTIIIFTTTNKNVISIDQMKLGCWNILI